MTYQRLLQRIKTEPVFLLGIVAAVIQAIATVTGDPAWGAGIIATLALLTRQFTTSETRAQEREDEAFEEGVEAAEAVEVLDAELVDEPGPDEAAAVVFDNLR